MPSSRNKVIWAAVIGGIFAIIAAVIGALFTNFTKPDQKQTVFLASPKGAGPSENATPTQTTEDQLRPTPDRKQTAFPTSPKSASPNENGTPTQTTEDQLRQRIRQEHGVRMMERTENELRCSVAPRGIYGFNYAFGFLDPDTLKLRRESGTTYFEFHKMTNGNVEIVAFVSPDVATMIQRDDRPPGFRATLYSSMWPSASAIVSIPLKVFKAYDTSRAIELDNGKRVEALDVTFK